VIIEISLKINSEENQFGEDQFEGISIRRNINSKGVDFVPCLKRRLEALSISSPDFLQILHPRLAF